MKRVCIDAGHGGRDPGATFRGMKESDITLAIAYSLKQFLMTHDYDVVMTRRMDETLTLRDRVNVANEANVDLFVSIHTNADPDPDRPGDPEARGEEVWYHPESKNGLALAQAIGNSLKASFPSEPYRGEKARALYVLRKTLAPAALVEVGFIDNSETAKQFLDARVLSRIAFALAGGIIAFAQASNA